MATLLPDQLLDCRDTTIDQCTRTRRWAHWVAQALTVTCLTACGTNPENAPGSILSTSEGDAKTSAPQASTIDPAHTNEVGPSDTHTERQSSSSSMFSTTSTTLNSTSTAMTTLSTTAVSVDELPPPSPEVFDPGGSGIPPGSGPLGVETTCDGADDDKNGVVDDVDSAGDGVCDCLKVATLGLHGEWGDGDVVTGWLKRHVSAAATDLDGQALSAERLEGFHVLLIRDVSRNHNASLSFSPQEANALWTWVRNGGGLMTVIGYSDPDESGNVNALLEPFALSYGSDQVVQGMGAAVPVSEWFEHPLSQGITQVGADNGYPVVGQGITFAGQGDYHIGKALTIGDGHVLVWGDEWVTYEDEWAADNTYQVDQFWKNALRWLTRRTQCQVNPE